ncbi:MAG: hypothetical protein AAB403_22010 [Planctomycetota bacterium]
MTANREVTESNSVLRFAIWAVIAATVNILLGKASIMAADGFPDGPIRTTLQLGMIASFAIGLTLLDRGYRRKTIPITPLYITGILCYVFVLFFVFVRMLFLAAVARGNLDL